jgi:hypothetical protein
LETKSERSVCGSSSESTTSNAFEPHGSDRCEEGSEFRGRLHQRNRVQLLERQREGLGQAPSGAGLEIIELRLEVLFVDERSQLLGGLELACDERVVDDGLSL